MAHPATVRIETMRKPAQRVENTKQALRAIRPREREEIIRHAKYHRMRRLPGEASAYVFEQMRGKYSEASIDRVLIEELFVRERQVSVSANHAMRHMAVIRETERSIREELSGGAA